VSISFIGCTCFLGCAPADYFLFIPGSMKTRDFAGVLRQSFRMMDRQGSHFSTCMHFRLRHAHHTATGTGRLRVRSTGIVGLPVDTQ
jgi:hypothetical protein